MRYPLPTILVIIFFVSSCNSGKSPDADKSPPNVLFIAVDDLRPEIGYFGAKHIHSPSIDKLASEGMVFNRAYCNVPVCGASRASILSGTRPGIHRFINFKTYLKEDYPGIIPLPMHFKNNGYTTISNGKVFHHEDDWEQAWDKLWRPSRRDPDVGRDYYTEKNIQFEKNGARGYPYEWPDVHDTTYFDGRIAKKTIGDLEELKKKDQPFFLAVGFMKPHLPFNAPLKYWDLYDVNNISLPENYLQPESTPRDAFHNSGELRTYSGVPRRGPVSDEMAKTLIHGYYASVSYVDAQIGKVLAKLKKLDLDDNTIVVLWGDHGWNLGNHMLWCKHCNFESSLRAPLIVKAPGKTAGQKTDVITEFIDVYPSLCELAGLRLPDHLDGESFVPVMEGKVVEERFAISKFFGGITLVQGDIFYTEFINEEGEISDRMMFDHSSDPLELNNIVEKNQYRKMAGEMSKFLRENWSDDFFIDKRIME